MWTSLTKLPFIWLFVGKNKKHHENVKRLEKIQQLCLQACASYNFNKRYNQGSSVPVQQQQKNTFVPVSILSENILPGIIN